MSAQHSPLWGAVLRASEHFVVDPAEKTIKLRTGDWAEIVSAVSKADVALPKCVEALEVAKKLADVMEGLTSSRSDDDFVWEAQAKIDEALTTARQGEKP